MAINKRAKPSYTYAIIGITLVLFLLGLLGWVVINGRNLSKTFKEEVALQVDFHDNTRDENITKLKGVLQQQPFVKQVTVISKEDALKMQSELEGEDIGGFLGYNPLFASLEVNLRAAYVNEDSIQKIEKFIRQSNVVREVSFPSPIVAKMNSNIRKVSWVMAGLSVLLLLVVIVLIDNTVRLAMFSNRFLIKTMQMVGATRAFISKPFDSRAILNGIISGGLATLALLAVITLSERWQPDLKTLHDQNALIFLVIGIMLLGVFISWFSTHRSVLKYLKLRLDDLY